MKQARILLVEDSESDILLIQNAIEESGIADSVEVVRNGLEAVKFLNNEGDYENKSIPHLVLLDINMPVMDGHEVLELIKSNNKTKHIPVIVLTTSSSPKDVMKAFQRHSNSYIMKPDNISDISSMMHNIKQYWFSASRIPNY